MRQHILDELRRRLDQYPAERYPVQHATASFHLGTELAQAERYREAEAALVTAVRLFGEDLPVERAKSLNALGIVLRADGRQEQALQAFGHAGSLFAEAGLDLEEGAARFNLGLALQELGEEEDAAEALRQARGLLDPARVPVQAAAAARELGSSLLRRGRPEEAIPLLEEALERFTAAGHQIGIGAAANALGLALVGTGQPGTAIEALRRAAAAHPKSLREDSYAMAKANLAMAYEAAGDPLRARLIARQARDVRLAAPPVAQLAREVLDRVGEEPGGLAAVLPQEPEEHRPATVRDELARWVDLDRTARLAEAVAWVEELVASGAPAALCEPWLAGLLELPPEAMADLIDSAVQAAATRAEPVRDGFQKSVSRAMARFHVPQWMRLKDAFAGAGRRVGLEDGW